MPHKHNQSIRHQFKKSRFQVQNWPAYDQALKNRGNLTIWITPEAIKSWKPECSKKKKGAQPLFSDLALETGLIFRSLYKLGLRQTKGFLESICSLVGLNLSVPDHTTLSRRSKTLSVTKFKRKPGKPLYL